MCILGLQIIGEVNVHVCKHEAAKVKAAFAR
jgi:hypothetical protein